MDNQTKDILKAAGDVLAHRINTENGGNLDLWNGLYNTLVPEHKYEEGRRVPELEYYQSFMLLRATFSGLITALEAAGSPVYGKYRTLSIAGHDTPLRAPSITPNSEHLLNGIRQRNTQQAINRIADQMGVTDGAEEYPAYAIDFDCFLYTRDLIAFRVLEVVKAAHRN